MKIVALAFLVASTPVLAGGSSHGAPSPEGSSFIPYSKAQRVTSFTSDRHWQTMDGVILVCPYAMENTYRLGVRACHEKDDDAKKNRWLALNDMKIPGFQISGIDYRFAGQSGFKTLIVYWEAIPAPVKPALPVLKPGIIQTDVLQITTEQVVIEAPKITHIHKKK